MVQNAPDQPVDHRFTLRGQPLDFLLRGHAVPEDSTGLRGAFCQGFRRTRKHKMIQM